MKTRPHGTVALLLALMVAGASQAETLEEAWAMAQSSDQAFAALGSEATAARESVAAARAERYPTLAVNGAFTQLEDSPAFDFSAAGLPVQLPEIFGGDNFANAGVLISLPLYTGGRISRGVAAATAQLEVCEAAVDGGRQDLKLAVARAYVDVLRAASRLDVADSNVASLGAYQHDVQAMFDREVVPRNDLLAAQVALADAQQNRLRAANARALALSAYNRRLGQPLDREVELVPSLASATADLTGQSLAALVTSAVAARPEIKALDAQARALGASADVERARLRPQLGLSGGYTYFENQALDRDTFAMASIGFEWAVFDGGRVRSRVASLRAAQQATSQRRSDVESQIELAVRQAWLALEESRARVAVTRDAVVQADENLRITRQQYAVGLSASTRVLEAEALRVQSARNRDEAVLDAELAVLELARAAGAL
jgi:outer membrane protein